MRCLVRFNGSPARDILPTPDGDVDVARIELDQAGSASRLFGGDQGRARTPETIEDNPISMRTVSNRVSDECDGFGRWVDRQLAFGGAIEDILAVIFPNVRSVPTEAAEFDIVDVRRGSLLEHKYEFVPRPIQRPHSRVRFAPDAKVFCLGVEIRSAVEKLPDFRPVHAHEMNRTIVRIRDGMA